ncbi:MAG: hypothetical protein V1850_04215 [Candidatus Bathyarchaeota archaeon]
MDEYLNEDSDFRKASLAVDKMYDGLMNGSYKLILAECEIETTLRKLHQRVTELNNSVKRSNSNEKKLYKEIDKLRIDVNGLRSSLIEFLLLLRGRVNRFNGIFDRTCKEYGLEITPNSSDKSVLRWDHLRPDPVMVLESLKYVEDLSRELENTKRNYYGELRSITSELRALGMKNIPDSASDEIDFQELRYNVDLILGTVDIGGLCEMSRSISKFFVLATELANFVAKEKMKVELDAKYAEPELSEFGIAFEKKGKFVYPSLEDVASLAATASEETPCIVTHISELSLGFRTLRGLVIVLKRLKLCLPTARAFMILLSKSESSKGLDYSEKYWRIAVNIPADLEQIANYVTTAGIFKNITKSLEIGIKR